MHVAGNSADVSSSLMYSTWRRVSKGRRRRVSAPKAHRVTERRVSSPVAARHVRRSHLQRRGRGNPLLRAALRRLQRCASERRAKPDCRLHALKATCRCGCYPPARLSRAPPGSVGAQQQRQSLSPAGAIWPQPQRDGQQLSSRRHSRLSAISGCSYDLWGDSLLPIFPFQSSFL